MKWYKKPLSIVFKVNHQIVKDSKLLKVCYQRVRPPAY
jgi:hypothetical protein